MAPEDTCPVCSSERLSVFYEQRGVPIHCNVLCRTREAALRAQRGDIRLALCVECGFITNTAFDGSRMAYTGAYENSLDHSARFRDYAAAQASRLVEQYGLVGETVLEIACGNGAFLRLLCQLGNNSGIGFDPRAAPEGDRDQVDGPVTFVHDFYREGHAGYRGKLVCCRHALEHMPDPLAFLRLVRRNIDVKHTAIVFFEVPNAGRMLSEPGIWDVIYEHCSYFHRYSLARCFAASGFEVLRIAEEYDGQFLCIDARPCPTSPRTLQVACADMNGLRQSVQEFSQRCQLTIHVWARQLARLQEAGRRIALWGAGSKGVSFLNVLQPQGSIAYVVDLNPRKQGMYVPGGGQKIVAPAFLRELRPDVVLVMNAIYLDEIRQSLLQMGLTAEVLAA